MHAILAGHSWWTDQVVHLMRFDLSGEVVVGQASDRSLLSCVSGYRC